MCWLASDGMRSYSSSSVINGSGTRLTITECPETEVATFFVLIRCASKILLMALATCGASMIAPSTTVSCAKCSVPKLTSSYPPLVDFSSTALIELEPMSSPTNCLLFPPNNDITRPLSPTPAKLAAPLHLTHLAFHPAVQDGFPKFPTVAKLECGNLAFSDVTVQRIRGDSQILRRLPHIHHFARFTHEEHDPWRTEDTPIPPDHWCTPVDAAEPWGTPRDKVMTPRLTDRQGFLGRSCPKNRGLFQAINGYSGVVIPVLESHWFETTITCGFRSRDP